MAKRTDQISVTYSVTFTQAVVQECMAHNIVQALRHGKVSERDKKKLRDAYAAHAYALDLDTRRQMARSYRQTKGAK